MTTATAPSVRTGAVSRGDPLSIPAELGASNLVDLVRRTVDRTPAKEALRWKLPRTRRQTGGEAETDDEVVWRSITYEDLWHWITRGGHGPAAPWPGCR